MNVKGIVVQPAIGQEIDHRSGNEGSQANQFYKVLGTEYQQAVYGRPQHFPHADLPGPEPDDKTGQTQQSQAGDKNSQSGEEAEYFAKPLVILVLPVEIIIQKEIFERVSRERLVPGGVNMIEGPGDIAGMYTYRIVFAVVEITGKE